MNRSILGISVLFAFAAAAHAQSTGDAACPQLPADSGLAWQHKATASSDFCRALRADGSEAFGLYIAKDSPFEPSRSKRAEQASIDGRAVQWYRSENALSPQLEGRETLVELPDGRVAHIWVQSNSQAQLDEALAQTQQLRFRAAQLSSK